MTHAGGKVRKKKEKKLYSCETTQEEGRFLGSQKRHRESADNSREGDAPEGS